MALHEFEEAAARQPTGMKRRLLRMRIAPNSSVHRSLRRVRRLMELGPAGRYAAGIVNSRLARRWGCHIDPTARIGGVLFIHPVGIVIGRDAVVEDGVTIFQNVTLGLDAKGVAPVVRSGATVFAGAVVVGVEVGEGAVVGANAVVLDNVAAGATVVGAPARRVG